MFRLLPRNAVQVRRCARVEFITTPWLIALAPNLQPRKISVQTLESPAFHTRSLKTFSVCGSRRSGSRALETTPEGKPLKTFEELNLIAPVQRALADEKYETPTPIQAQTIPAALLGRDVLGCAQTGTGKTAVPRPEPGRRLRSLCRF